MRTLGNATETFFYLCSVLMILCLTAISLQELWPETFSARFHYKAGPRATPAATPLALKGSLAR